MTKRYKSDQTLQIWPNVTNPIKRYNCPDKSDVILADQLLTRVSFCSFNTRLIITFWHDSSLEILINKRPASISLTRTSSTLSKKHRCCAKQGNLSVADRVAEFWRNLFNADGGKLFCWPYNLTVVESSISPLFEVILNIVLKFGDLQEKHRSSNLSHFKRNV